MDRGKDMRVLCYALGQGFGHPLRIYSLIRKLLQADPGNLHTTCAVYAQHLPFLQQWVERDGLGERVQLLGFSPGWDAGDCGRAFLSTAQRYQPTALVFDTFPRGLGLEIPADFFRSTSAHKTLINASLPRSYVSSTELHPFVDSLYDSVITPGEEGWYRYHSVSGEISRPSHFSTAPFLVRSGRELPSRLQAAATLQCDATRPTILFVATGNWEECREVESLYQDTVDRLQSSTTMRVQVRLLTFPSASGASSTFSKPSHPIMEVLPAVDMVVGSAGYHLHHETQSLGIPGLLVARQRTYDLQSARTNFRHVKDGAQVLVEWNRVKNLQSHAATPDSGISFENGAEEAANYLLQRWSFESGDGKRPAIEAMSLR